MLSPMEKFALRTRFAVAQAARVGWYAAGSYAATRRAAEIEKRLPPAKKPVITAPGGVPGRPVLLEGVRDLLAEDLANVEAGLYAMPADEPGGLPAMLERRRRYFADLPEVIRRRSTGAHQEVANEAIPRPRYYKQNFHFQSDGWLSDDSASIYDTQVEMLFLGAGAAMRRQALVPIAHELRRHDQRRLRLVDVASGTGAFAREVARAFPRLPVTALDLSEPYTRLARRALGRRPRAASVVSDAEALPFADGALDILSSVYLFHELPPKVRTAVAAEMARATRPGGLVVIMDSLQDGDTPRFDGLLELFPQMFHEPYYRSYLTWDLAGAFAAHDLVLVESRTVFLSKLFVFRKR